MNRYECLVITIAIFIFTGGRKRTWQSRGRGQLSKQNQNQGVPTTNPPPLHHPAYRFPAPQPGDSLPPQASPLEVQRPAFPPQSQFMSHPTQDSPPFGMRHMVPPRRLPPRGPLDMMPQRAVGPFPGPHPGPIGNVPIPSSSPSRPLIGVQHVPGHWPVGPPPGFVPRYPTPGPTGTYIGFGLPQPPPHPLPPPPPPPNLWGFFSCKRISKTLRWLWTPCTDFFKSKCDKYKYKSKCDDIKIN